MPYKIAYQLYSSRNFPPLPAQFPILKDMGYDAIEPWLPAYEASPKDFRSQLDDAGLACYGFHMPLSGLVDEPQRFIDIAKTIGATLLIPPWLAPEERGTTAGDWQRLGDKLAVGAGKAKAAGLRVAWHNHDFEFKPLADGSFPIDHILGAADNFGFEIDVGWIVRGGADPKPYLEKYADRIWAIQTKDTAPLGTQEDDGWAATGDGIIDWRALVPLFHKTKADHLVTEHDNPGDWQRFARRSINHLRAIGL